MNDHGNHGWPEEEPPSGRHGQWPSGDEPGPQWPSGDEPVRPQRPPRYVRPQQPRQPRQPQPPQSPQQPQWPGGEGQHPPRRPDGGGRPPAGPRQGVPPHHPQGGRPMPPPPPGRGQQGPPPPGSRPPGGPPQNVRRQPPPPPRQQGGRSAADQPTGLVPPAPGAPEDREPELITHRAHNGTGHDDHDGYGYDDHDGYGYDDDRWSDDDQRFHESGFDEDPDGTGADKAPLTPAQRKKRRWRRIRRTLYACVGIFLVLPALAFTITYFLVDVPSPEEVAAEQGKVVTFYYANGKEMGRDIPPDGGNRIILKPEDITPVVRHAVYAAEDATFETNAGFDISGIMRAAWNQVTGGVGGGSTISQQYIKKATQNEEYSYTRKWTELVKAFKMNNEQSKDEIITAYLNTIYFGRGAYGIQTAAQAYFGKDAKDLNASEAALLAGMIQQPGRSENAEVRLSRWTYVMDQMVKNRWITEAERRAAKVPTPIPVEQSKPDAITGPDAFIEQRVKAELEAKGYPEEKLQSGGYKVYLTIDERAQRLAKRAVNEVMADQPAGLKRALVAVDPRTGGVLAYYGGPNKPGVDEIDWANTPRNPGSAYKPFDLVALLQRGKGLGEVYDGSSPRQFGSVTVSNSENAQCPQCTVAEAMERSINTVFYDMVVNELGPKAVVDAALDAGIPEKHGDLATMGSLDGNISIGGGDTLVTPTDMAGAYATFAANGVRHDTHFVAKLTTSDGDVIFDETTKAATKGEPAFSSDPEKSKQIAGNVTQSLLPVPISSEIACADGRPCAGKTGTHQYVSPDGEKSVNDNSQAWMVGYTPQISTASYVGADRNTVAIRDASGSPIYGSGLPGEIWQEFMNLYLEGMPEAEFPEVEPIGKVPTVPEEDDSSPTSSAPSSTSSTTTPPPPPSPTTETPTPTSSTETETSTDETETDDPSRPTGILPGGEWGRDPSEGGGGNN
ncbi:transglycosylase domain-containing protein [Prauserella muralis]|uniref:transglycosylase domain-containing protein n=1 Tax=Prauserella muralis TaxID=588067 RepID=UPI001FE7A512|nr:transglycosylase domain-containing protein [Prauserella muralis]